MVKPAQVVNGLLSFAEAVILPALEGWQKFTATASLILMGGRANALVPTLLAQPLLSTLGLVDEQGMVDVDAAIDAAKEAVKRQGKLTVDLPVLGEFSFGEADFDVLREHILRA